MLFFTKNNYIFSHSEATRTSMKYQFMPLNRKFSQLFNGITCYFVSLEKKYATGQIIMEETFFFSRNLLLTVFVKYLCNHLGYIILDFCTENI